MGSEDNKARRSILTIHFSRQSASGVFRFLNKHIGSEFEGPSRCLAEAYSAADA